MQYRQISDGGTTKYPNPTADGLILCQTAEQSLYHPRFRSIIFLASLNSEMLSGLDI